MSAVAPRYTVGGHEGVQIAVVEEGRGRTGLSVGRGSLV